MGVQEMPGVEGTVGDWKGGDVAGDDSGVRVVGGSGYDGVCGSDGPFLKQGPVVFEE